MYRGNSPLFDAPDLQPVRRMRPLPKRSIHPTSPPTAPSLMASKQPVSLASGGSASFPLQDVQLSSSPQDLLAQTETLSSALALHSYYLPSPLQSLGLRSDDDEDPGDPDYSDHLQQAGNTKKRKVPLNASGRTPSLESADHAEPEDNNDQPTEKAIPTGKAERQARSTFARTTAPYGSATASKKSKLTAAAIAGLQHKEMLKVRKRQFASVLNALTHGDTLALDQALSATFSSAAYPPAFEGKPRVRPSRRRNARITRAVCLAMKHPHPDQVPLISHFDFSFSFPCPTADRLVAMKAEVASLRSRFEEELARQARRAARLPASTANATMKSGHSPPTKVRNRTGHRSAQHDQRESPSPSPLRPGAEASPLGLSKPKTKKKKRSALANASNPHHLRNYVPSRLPYNTGATAPNPSSLIQQQAFLSPLPIAFLSAEIPPRRKKKASSPAVTLTNPMDEWICPFCEYELFYGDERDYQRAIRNRKKILRRRRRARERASAAASGKAAAFSMKDRSSHDDDGTDDEYEDSLTSEDLTDRNIKDGYPPRKNEYSGG